MASPKPSPSLRQAARASNEARASPARTAAVPVVSVKLTPSPPLRAPPPVRSPAPQAVAPAATVSPPRTSPSQRSPPQQVEIPHAYALKAEVPHQTPTQQHQGSPKRIPGRTRTPRYTSPTRRLLPHTPGMDASMEHTKQPIKALEATRQRLEDQGKYLEAEEVHRQVVDLKLEEENKRKAQVRKQHLEELLGVEQAHLDQFAQFNEDWDRQMRAFEARSAAAAQEQALRHDQAMADMRREVEQHIEQTLASRSFPPTKHLLELRKSEKALAKQREYRQAHAVKEAADAAEVRELDERVARLRVSFSGKLERLKESQAKEAAVLQQKVESEHAVLEEGRKHELDALLLRYRNMKSEMESGKVRAEIALDQRIAALSPQIRHGAAATQAPPPA